MVGLFCVPSTSQQCLDITGVRWNLQKEWRQADGKGGGLRSSRVRIHTRVWLPPDPRILPGNKEEKKREGWEIVVSSSRSGLDEERLFSQRVQTSTCTGAMEGAIDFCHWSSNDHLSSVSLCLLKWNSMLWLVPGGTKNHLGYTCNGSPLFSE